MFTEFRMQALCQGLDQYNEIIIYGTGNYARRIYPVLVEYGLKNKILCFTQTEKSELKSIDGRPVVQFETLPDHRDSCVILIATSELYTKEIRQVLVAHQYLHILSLVDYRIRTERELEILDTFDEYCDFIADWYIENKAEKVDKQEVVQRLLNRGHNAGTCKDSKLIVCICGHRCTRNNKIIGSLKRNGYNVIMLTYHALDKRMGWCTNELVQLDIPRIQCHCVEELLYEALQYKPLVYYFVPRWADCLWAKIMLRNKKKFGNIVLELYDVLNDGIINQSQERLDTEKYALENADGIIWRWFSKEYLESKGFQFQGKSIHFLDYCSHIEKESFQLNTESSVVKLCEVSGFADSFVEDRLCNTKYIDWARLGEILEKVGNRKDCIFHYYAGSMKKENIERCRQYEMKYNNFKFFLGVEHDELLLRLGDYDYGCDFYTDGEWPPDDMLIGGFTGSSRKNCLRNILFDYLSAGLPIITTTPKKLLEYLQPYDVVVKMNISNLDVNYLRENRVLFKSRAHIARTELDIDNHISELINFFNNLS